MSKRKGGACDRVVALGNGKLVGYLFLYFVYVDTREL